MRSKLFPFAVLTVFLGLGLAACGDDDGGTNNNNTNPCVVDGNCDIAAGENGVNCAADCVTQCDMTISGTDHDYLVKTLFIPDSQTAAKSTGVDLDGDGTIDNKIGGLISALAGSGTDVNASVNETIGEGSLILLARLRVDGFPTDDVMFAQMFQGAIPTGGSSPMFDGEDVVDIDADSPTDLYLCGSMRNGTLIAGPASLSVTFPLPGVTNPLTVTLEKAQMVTSDDGEITEDGFTGLILGGGLSKNQVDTSIVPAVLDFLNQEIADDPTSTIASTVLEMFDGCPDYGITIEGCEDVVPGAGDCLVDEIITSKELVCHSIVNQVLTPDVDPDGANPLISLGLMVDEAVTVTINP